MVQKRQDTPKSPLQAQISRFFRILVTLFYISILPLIIVSFIPIYIFRFFVSILKKFLRPDLVKFVHPRSSVLSAEPFEKNPYWNLVIWITQDGILDMERFKREFLADFVMKKCQKTGKLLYPEYSSYFQNWLGFQYWKKEDDFKIEEHIRVYDGKYSQLNVVNDATLLNIIRELTWKKWTPGKSPWEFLQIVNYEKENDTSPEVKKTILFFRLHHGFGDGYYILKLLMEEICGVKIAQTAQPKYARRNIFQKLLYGTLFLIKGPYQWCEMMLKANDANDWHISKEEIIRPTSTALTDPIPLSLIKEVKNLHGVSFTSVVNAAISGGIRNLMLEKCGRVPSKMTSAVAVPISGRKDYLKPRNRFIFAFTTLPVGISDPLQRLKESERYLQKLKNSSVHFINFYKVPLVGSLLRCMMTPFNVNNLSTALISNFPGAPTVPRFKNVNVLDMMFTCGLGEGSTSLGFFMTSYLNHLRIYTSIVPNVLESDEEVQLLNNKIIQEFHVLKSIPVP